MDLIPDIRYQVMSFLNLFDILNYVGSYKDPNFYLSDYFKKYRPSLEELLYGTSFYKCSKHKYFRLFIDYIDEVYDTHKVERKEWSKLSPFIIFDDDYSYHEDVAENKTDILEHFVDDEKRSFDFSSEEILKTKIKYQGKYYMLLKIKYNNDEFTNGMNQEFIRDIILNKYLSLHKNKYEGLFRPLCLDFGNNCIFSVVPICQKTTDEIILDSLNYYFQGLYDLQCLGLCHTNIKNTSFVMVDNQIKLSDYSIFQFSGDISSCEKDGISYCICPINYRSPECLIKDNQLTIKSDVWGLLIYIISTVTNNSFHQHLKNDENEYELHLAFLTNNLSYIKENEEWVIDNYKDITDFRNEVAEYNIDLYQNNENKVDFINHLVNLTIFDPEKRKLPSEIINKQVILPDIELELLSFEQYIKFLDEINVKMLAILFDWMRDVLIKIKFEKHHNVFVRTVLSVLYYLKSNSVKRSHLQLIGCTSIFINVKVNTNDFDSKQCVEICDGAFDESDILQMEEFMLQYIWECLISPIDMSWYDEIISRIKVYFPEKKY